MGPCKGYVIDHVKPLACGGADAAENMQWQTIAEGKAKDKWERKVCEKWLGIYPATINSRARDQDPVVPPGLSASWEGKSLITCTNTQILTRIREICHTESSL